MRFTWPNLISNQTQPISNRFQSETRIRLNQTRVDRDRPDQTQPDSTRIGLYQPILPKGEIFIFLKYFIYHKCLTVSGCKALNIFGKWLWSLNVPTIGIDNLKYHWSVVNFAIDNWTKAQAQLDIEDIEWRLLRMSSSNWKIVN